MLHTISKLMDSIIKQKSFIHIWDEGLPPRYHPASVEGYSFSIQPLLIALTGIPVTDYFSSSAKSPLLRVTGEFSLQSALPMGAALGSHLTFPTR